MPPVFPVTESAVLSTLPGVDGDPKLTLPPQLELQLLTVPGQIQTAWLEAEDYGNDELGMQFDDWFEVFLPNMKRDGLLDGRADETALAIATQLEVMRKTGPRLLWTTTAALHDAPEWERLRDLARAALDALGVPASGYDVLADVRPAKMIKALHRLLRWLARPAAEQRLDPDKRFASLVHDLPLTLDDCVTVFVPRLTSIGLLGPVATAAVTSVRDFIRSPAVQTDPALQDRTTLATSPTWATIRELARTARDALGSVA
jgi:hypothetical protein